MALRSDGAPAGGAPSAAAAAPGAASLAPAVRLRGFSFAYAGCPAPVISGVDAEVPQGAFALLCGATGSGKTTLLRCLSPVLAPRGMRSGGLELFGCGEADPLDVGYVFQQPDDQIVCDTVWREMAFGLENMGLAPAAMRRRVAEVATVFGIGEWFDASTAELSGGQKQLLNVASVLAMRPRLLLLDEPTSQLDPVAAMRLRDALRTASCDLGLTVVVATHAPEEFAGLADVAFELEGGRLRARDIAALRAEAAACAMPPAPVRVPVPPAEQGVSAAAPHEDAPPAVVEDAWFAYGREGKDVLRGLCLDVREGEVLSLVGANGCGKSTLLKLVAGVREPWRGRVERRLRTSQAYLPQDPRLLFSCDTVAEELALAGVDVAGCCMRLGIEAAEAASLSPLDLSGGAQQMLALEKLLAARPRLFLLDEPAKGLDADGQLALALAVRRAAEEGATVLLATHDLSLASRVSDRIALVFDGGVACVEAPRAFCEGNVYYRPKANGFTRAWDAHAARAASAPGRPEVAGSPATVGSCTAEGSA